MKSSAYEVFSYEALHFVVRVLINTAKKKNICIIVFSLSEEIKCVI